MMVSLSLPALLELRQGALLCASEGTALNHALPQHKHVNPPRPPLSTGTRNQIVHSTDPAVTRNHLEGCGVRRNVLGTFRAAGGGNDLCTAHHRSSQR
jgi:hypothetical protein